MKKALIFIMLSSFLVGGHPANESKNVNQQDRCDRYARRAVEQNEENIRRGCGFVGGRWHSDYQRHYNWCREVSWKAAEEEDRARQEQLDHCIEEKVTVCERYARIAVEQNEENLRRGCGFVGGRWQSNYDEHYNWCLEVPPEDAEAENRARRELLEECMGEKPRFCEHYARTAVEQNEENLRRGCGFVGGRWQSNYDEHYNWCLEVPPEDAEAENRARRELLEECMGEKPRFCEHYARTAVEQNEENLRRGCGFVDGRWQSNYDEHYNWCLEVPRETAEAENRIRQELLDGCVGSKTDTEAKPPTPTTTTTERVIKPAPAVVIPDSQKIRLAVIEFKEVDSVSQSQNMGSMVSEIFTTEVVNSAAFKIVEREQLKKILQEHTIVQVGIVDTTQAQKLGKMLGADAIITGSVMKIGKNLRIDARVIEVKTGIIVSAESRLCTEDLNEISRNVSEITRGLAEKFYK